MVVVKLVLIAMEHRNTFAKAGSSLQGNAEAWGWVVGFWGEGELDGVGCLEGHKTWLLSASHLTPVQKEEQSTLVSGSLPLVQSVLFAVLLHKGQ